MSNHTKSPQSIENKYQSKLEELSKLESEYIKAGNHLRYLQCRRMKEGYAHKCANPEQVLNK